MTRLDELLAATAEVEEVSESALLRGQAVLEAAIAGTTADEPVRSSPGGITRPKARKRRALITGAISVVALTGGVGVAAATVPAFRQELTGAFGFQNQPGNTHTPIHKPRLLITTPGPDGTTIALTYADASNDGYCISIDATETLTPGVVGYPSGSCGPKKDSFGAEGYGETGARTGRSSTPGPFEFAANVLGATTVRILFSDGTTSPPLPISQGWTAGWITGQETLKHPTLTGYDTRGNIVGHKILSP